MSLVGPRPEVRQHVALYDSVQRQVLDLVPSITYPASLKYRWESDLFARASDPQRTYVEQIRPRRSASTWSPRHGLDRLPGNHPHPRRTPRRPRGPMGWKSPAVP